MDYTVDELISVCIARQVRAGDVLAQGINTPLVMAGYILAKLTHAPDVRFASAIGQGICEDWEPLRLATTEDFWLRRSLLHVGFAVGATELLPRYNPKEFFRPAQVDPVGNFNNVAFGKDYARPRMRLPGTGGIPDVTTYSAHVYLYVPRHSRVTFVPAVDFVSGLGHVPERRRGSGPLYCITDLGQFDWHDGRMRAVSLHPGVSAAYVQKKTGFPLAIPADIARTDPPDPEQLRLLREVIDPLAVRKLETLGGQARRDHLRAILAAEQSL
ncbi:MAG: hypothetical protein ACOCYT_04665 [Chloroflexota bacterium]